MFAIRTLRTTMRRAVHTAAAGRWSEANASGTLTLVFDDRHRRRVRLTTDDGADLLLDLPRAVALADGDGLLLDDGEWLRVAAAPEPLLEVVAVSPQHLARLAWHIGNRHLQAEPFEDRIRIRPDHVVAEMLRGLGAEVRDVTQPFQPEGGAYDQKSDPGSHAGSQQAGHTHA